MAGKPKFSLAFEAFPFGPVRFIGKEVQIGRKNLAPALWQAFLGDGSNALLQRLPERLSPEGDTIGYMGEYDGETKSYVYIAGVFTQPGTPVPEGFSFRDLPECLMGVCWITGDTPDLEKGAHAKTEKIMAKNGYGPDYGPGFSMEYYSFKKYASVQEGKGPYTFGYYLPCKPAEKPQGSEND